MRTIDISSAPHQVNGATLTYADGKFRYRVKLPIGSPIINVAESRRGMATMTFATLSKATMQLTAPATTIESIFTAIGGTPK